MFYQVRIGAREFKMISIFVTLAAAAATACKIYLALHISMRRIIIVVVVDHALVKIAKIP